MLTCESRFCPLPEDVENYWVDYEQSSASFMASFHQIVTSWRSKVSVAEFFPLLPLINGGSFF